MMKITPQILPVIIFFAFCLLPGGTAKAQGSSDDLFYPSGAWLIGPSSLTPVSAAETGEGLPCIMMNQYNNGYVVRISGGGGRIMAMAIDFRQDVFERGKDYRINLRIAEQGFDITFPAYAYNKQSLLFGTKEAVGLYKALKKAKALDVKVGNKTSTFVMAGIKDGMARMEQCYNGGDQKNPVPDNISKQAHSALPVLDNHAVNAGKEGAGNDSRAAYLAENASEEEDVLIPMPSGSPSNEAVSAPRKKPMADSKEIAADKKAEAKPVEAGFDLEKALAKAGGEISAMEPSAGTVQDTKAGSMQKPVTERPAAEAHIQVAEARKRDKPEGRNVARHWQSPYEVSAEDSASGTVIEKRGRTQKDILIMPPVDPDKRFDRPFAGKPIGEESGAMARDYNAYGKDKDMSQSDSIRRWRAIGGANLRETLFNWSREANVRLLWKANRDFPVEESFVVQGSYEDAVAKILNQYRNGDRDADSIPAGRLYHDPAADQKVLLIEMP